MAFEFLASDLATKMAQARHWRFRLAQVPSSMAHGSHLVVFFYSVDRLMSIEGFSFPTRMFCYPQARTQAEMDAPLFPVVSTLFLGA